VFLLHFAAHAAQSEFDSFDLEVSLVAAARPSGIAQVPRCWGAGLPFPCPAAGMWWVFMGFRGKKI